jgi:hypothetical protein
MNPAAFAASDGNQARGYTHTKHVTRSSLGETTTPRARNLVVNLPIDRD